VQYVGKGGGHLKPPGQGVRAFSFKKKSKTSQWHPRMRISARRIDQACNGIAIDGRRRGDNGYCRHSHTLSIVIASKAVLALSWRAGARDGKDFVRHHSARYAVQVVTTGTALA